jgi:tripartite-type tricarboxylate transporter receptor subunit TctC
VVPTGTPKAVIARVNADTAKVLGLPDVKARLDATGMVPEASTPEALDKKIRAEIALWRKVVNGLGLTAD